MLKEKIFIVGSGWHAKVVIDIIENNNQFEIEGIIDFYNKENEFLWYNMISDWIILKDILKWIDKINVFIALWENSIREKEYLTLLLDNKNIYFPNIIHNSAIISKNSILWNWLFIWPWVIINTNSIIWDFALVNTKVSIDHDCSIWKFASIWPGATLWWWVKVWNYSHIWLWANILEKIYIWENSLIWASSLINKDIINNFIVYWVPWKIIRKRIKSEKIYK